MYSIDRHELARFKMATVIIALRDEIRTGRVAMIDPMIQAALTYGIKARTKKAALARLVALYEREYGE